MAQQAASSGDVVAAQLSSAVARAAVTTQGAVAEAPRDQTAAQQRVTPISLLAVADTPVGVLVDPAQSRRRLLDLRRDGRSPGWRTPPSRRRRYGVVLPAGRRLDREA